MIPTENAPVVALVVGARPQFIKCAPLLHALRDAGLVPRLIHTGQHYDAQMSDVFFRELNLGEPDVHLGVGGGSPLAQLARMLTALEGALGEPRPAMAVVFGDTTTTLAGALAAKKLGLPLAHVEAGLRSHNRAMPEEQNRIVADHLADVLFCHSESAAAQLRSEDIAGRIDIVGDTMREMLALMVARLREENFTPQATADVRGPYIVVTVHRAGNTESPETLAAMLSGLNALGMPVIFPVHPRARQMSLQGDATLHAMRWPNVRFIEPLGYREMLALTAGARLVATDSGGLQKEAYFLNVPCLTLRGETEWTETLGPATNVLSGESPAAAHVESLARGLLESTAALNPKTIFSSDEREAAITDRFGPADASRRIAAALADFLAHH